MWQIQRDTAFLISIPMIFAYLESAELRKKAQKISLDRRWRFLIQMVISPLLRNQDWMEILNRLLIIRRQSIILIIWDARLMCWKMMDMPTVTVITHQEWRIISLAKKELFKRRCIIFWKIQCLTQHMVWLTGILTTSQRIRKVRLPQIRAILEQRAQSLQRQPQNQKKELVRM